MTFQRKAPNSFRYLLHHLGAVLLEGYNIVGDGTPQAFIPILTGKTETELPLTRKRYPEANFVDIYPMIWKNFSDNGYATLYGEDSAAVGTFTYRLKGFQKQPTDHYLRTFFQMTEREKLSTCLGSEPQHIVWLRYAREFYDQYPDVPKFLLMHHSVLSHGDLNTLQYLDVDLETHLRQMKTLGHLNNTLLIVMADHGHRFAKLRQTHQGQLEERLPFFALALPEEFRRGRGKKAYENLQRNAHRLTTPFDIYSTLLDILQWPDDTELENVNLKQVEDSRSLSLWRLISESRTCEQADIQPHWCTCLKWEPVKTDYYQVEKSATAVVETINAETAGERRLCARLSLAKVHDAKRFVPRKDLLRYKDVKDLDGFVPDLAGNTKLAFAYYQIRLRTEPGNALYEATVRYDTAVGEQITVDLASISHINKYGDRPHCIIDKNYFLATFCVCYDKI